jgi:uncharacterized DUF497 family protein
LVEIEFDPVKDALNRARHGIGLGDFAGFDADPLVTVDARRDYGEVRYRAVGRIEGRGYCPVFTYRGPRMRLISLRAAHEQEMRRHGL